MTNIKEVIHLYLGCEVEMNGVRILTPSRLETILNGGTGYRLRLRRLDSITWADCPDWFKDWMPDGFDILISRQAKYFYIEIDSKANDGFRLTIHSDGSMSCECKDNGEQYGYRGGELFAHLLKQGFDLFGLIDSGQAIDKNLKQ